MARSSSSYLRSTAVAVAASAFLVGGVTSVQAAPAGAEAAQQRSVPAEVRTFTGTALGTSQGQAVDSAIRRAYEAAQSAGWQANHCHVRATQVRSVGGGVYSATAELFCQR
ncbi:hypothetical protein [Streptomyces sp. NPDC058953]|uniref:hypothetical protein n=1 Tax=unclassified Streptomyces TaxID=2593676 RepID=UPI0036A87BE4